MKAQSFLFAGTLFLLLFGCSRSPIAQNPIPLTPQTLALQGPAPGFPHERYELPVANRVYQTDLSLDALNPKCMKYVTGHERIAYEDSKQITLEADTEGDCKGKPSSVEIHIMMLSAVAEWDGDLRWRDDHKFPFPTLTLKHKHASHICTIPKLLHGFPEDWRNHQSLIFSSHICRDTIERKTLK